MTDINRLIPVQEAFNLAGMKTTRGYEEIAAGRLKVIRNGRRTFVLASELQRYINALAVAA